MLNVVVLGAGKWAHECWALVLSENVDRYTVTGVIDPELTRARSLAAALRIDTQRAHTSLHDALNHDGSPTAGIVLTPPEQHAACIVELAELGLHIITEKPLTTTAHAATAIADVVNCTGRKLAVVQNYRYQPGCSDRASTARQQPTGSRALHHRALRRGLPRARLMGRG